MCVKLSQVEVSHSTADTIVESIKCSPRKLNALEKIEIKAKKCEKEIEFDLKFLKLPLVYLK